MTARVMVDSNVLLDVFEEDPVWYAWSSTQIARLSEASALIINQVIFSEVSVGFNRIEEVDTAMPALYFVRETLPWEAAFLAGKCFVQYRRKGGLRRSPLPDFYIGAHALVGGMRLLTRDAARYRTYFPKLRLISPE